MKTFHISEDPQNYYLTETTDLGMYSDRVVHNTSSSSLHSVVEMDISIFDSDFRCAMHVLNYYTINTNFSYMNEQNHMIGLIV